MISVKCGYSADTKYHRDNTKARKLLGWNPRPAKETVLDTAACLIENKIV
ncbi:MAG: hypothetical protein SOH80_09875 [Eubacteriales bacterium]|jgi:nucleoside-diphosphate-sugar epimerase